MSYLIPLSLIGVGSADVESLSSYVYRLAHVHGVSVLRLLDYAFTWYSEKYPERAIELGQFRSTKDLSILVRPNETTRKIVEVLSLATGREDLRCGTFLAFSMVLDRSSRSFSDRLRWCPRCIFEQLVHRSDVYFKLAWSLTDLTHCPVHQLKLSDTCNWCGSYQSKLGIRRSLEYCCGCSQTIYGGAFDEIPIDSWINNASDLLECVNLIAHDKTLEFPSNAISCVLSEILDRAWKNQDEHRLWKIMPRDDFIGLATGTKSISLLSARRIAFQLGLRLVDLLEGTLRTTSDILDPEWTQNLPEPMRPRRRPKTGDRDAILQRFATEYFFTSRYLPPSLKEVARELEVSVGYLHYHFPLQSQEFIRKHRAYLDSKKQVQGQEARAAVLDFFTSESNAAISKSRKNALRVLRLQTYLPKNLLRQEIDFVLRSYSSGCDE